MSFIPSKEDACVCTLLEKMGALTQLEVSRLREEKLARGWTGHTSDLAVVLGMISVEQLAKAIAYNKRMLAGEAVEVMVEIANDSAEFMLAELAAHP